jgi:hypothetical protein
MVLAGILAWGEYRERTTQGATDLVGAVRQLVVTIAESNSASLACFALGTVLVVVGGAISVASGFVER